jgi:hypothetical protein
LRQKRREKGRLKDNALGDRDIVERRVKERHKEREREREREREKQTDGQSVRRQDRKTGQEGATTLNTTTIRQTTSGTAI